MAKIPRRIVRWLRHPATVVTLAQLAFRLGKDAHRVHKRQINMAEFRARLGDHMGSISGGVAGAWVGARAGTVVAPGLGTALGAVVGGFMGESLGGRAARMAVERSESAWSARRGGAEMWRHRRRSL